jgi:WXG100 family type VII secretion target
MRMDYGEIAEAIKTFTEAGKMLEELNSQVKQWATVINDGALLGDAGEALGEAFTVKLCPKVQLLTDKMVEVQGDLTKAADDFQAAEKKAAGMFS